MSNATGDELEDLSDALGSREAVMQEINKLEDTEDDLDTLIQEMKSTLHQVEDADRQTIVDTYTKSLKEDYSLLIDENESFAPGEYETDLQDFIGDIQSVLRHPEAESAIESIEDWLVSAGASPFENKSREHLIQVVERDVERVEVSNNKAKTAFEKINTDLGAHRKDLVNLIKKEIADVESISGIETIASELDRVSTKWPYPWGFEVTDEPGPNVSERVDELLLTKIKNIIDQSDSLQEFTTLSKERLFVLDESLDKIASVVTTITERFSLLENSDVGVPIDASRDRLIFHLSNASSIADVRAVINDVEAITKVMNDVRTESIERFDTPDDEIPESIQQVVSEINDDYESLIKIRKGILTGEVEDYDKALDEFNGKNDDAEDKIKIAKDRVNLEIDTGKDIAETFELEEKVESLQEIELALVRTETVEDLVNQAKECRTVRKEIRSIVTESHLTEDMARVFEISLEYEAKNIEKTPLIDMIAEETKKSRIEVLESLLQLQDESLLSIKVSGA